MTSADRPIGVVVMAYGSPAGLDDVEAYYTHVRHGRPPTPELTAALLARYEAVGGVSRLAERTESQRAALAAALEERAPGRFRVATGQRHAAPFISDAVEDLVAPGDGSAPCDRVIGLALAPHYSGYSIGYYASTLAAAAGEHGVRSETIPSWYDLPAYRNFLAASVRERLDADGVDLATTRVVFTAHSLPERLLVDDPYPDQLRSGAATVATTLGLPPERWMVAWQSAGATPEPWRGPDVREVIGELADSGTVGRVIVCPHGFVSDHLEVAYDLDIVASELATCRGLAFARTRMLNDDPDVFAALAERVEDTAVRT